MAAAATATATATATTDRVSYAEYLAAEARAGIKHEYRAGVVRAMAGGTPQHGALAVRITSLIDAALGGRPCRVFNSDVRVRVPASAGDLATYPDASVVCGALELAPDDANAIANPVVLVEVLSDATEAYDRGEKAARYRQIPSLREYLLVSQHTRRLELHRRGERGHWELHEAGPGQALTLASIEVTLRTDDVYLDRLAG